MPLIFIGSLQLGWAAKSSQTSQTCLSWLAQMVCGKTSQTCFSCLGLHRSTPPPLSFPPYIHLSLSLSLSLSPFLHSSIPLSLQGVLTSLSLAHAYLFALLYYIYVHTGIIYTLVKFLFIILLHIRQVFVHYIHVLTYIHIR